MKRQDAGTVHIDDTYPYRCLVTDALTRQMQYVTVEAHHELGAHLRAKVRAQHLYGMQEPRVVVAKMAPREPTPEERHTKYGSGPPCRIHACDEPRDAENGRGYCLMHWNEVGDSYHCPECDALMARPQGPGNVTGRCGACNRRASRPKRGAA